MTIRSHEPYERPLGQDPASGRPVSVRCGRYGPFVQIGSGDDDVKPEWRGLEDDQSMYTIQLPEALALFKLPRSLGNLPTGEAVSVGTCQYGPYLKYEARTQSGTPPRPTYIALERKDPLTITLTEAISEVQAGLRRRQFRLIRGGLDAMRESDQAPVDHEPRPESDV